MWSSDEKVVQFDNLRNQQPALVGYQNVVCARDAFFVAHLACDPCTDGRFVRAVAQAGAPDAYLFGRYHGDRGVHLAVGPGSYDISTFALQNIISAKISDLKIKSVEAPVEVEQPKRPR